MSNPHIVRAFDTELSALARTITTMGEFASMQFAGAVSALLQHDLDMAKRVIDQDAQLDALRKEVSSAAASVISRRQPMAADLDEILSDFRVSEDLERVGDLAKNTAKRAIAIAARTFPPDVTEPLQALAEAASSQLRSALSAYIQRDAQQALAAREQDEALDELHTQVFRELVAKTQGDQAQVVGFVHLLFCAKNIERVGDHAAHVAEAAYILATGHAPDSERRRADESSSVTGDTIIGIARI